MCGRTAPWPIINIGGGITRTYPILQIDRPAEGEDVEGAGAVAGAMVTNCPYFNPLATIPLGGEGEVLEVAEVRQEAQG